MSPERLETPILLVIFNRPSTTQAVMESIRRARPKALFVAADGPREGVVGEAERCAEARRIATSLDWPCELHTLFHDRNRGCAGNTTAGISWFLDAVTEGIILDDDCVGSRSFYIFCQDLLRYYRDDTTIMHIGGNSHQYGRRRGAASYYFSRLANFWGWATWQRAWREFDPNLRPSWDLHDDWSAPWQLSIERAGGVAIVPNKNLVKNVGFGPEATHTKEDMLAARVEAEELSFPLVHPSSRIVDRAADVFTYYAHHRLVRYHNLIWMYQLRDWLYWKLKPIKRALLGPGRSA